MNDALPRTLFDRVFDDHVVETWPDGRSLLYVDCCLIHEGSRHAFDVMEREGQQVANPAQVFAFSDHYVPTTRRELGVTGIADTGIRGMVERLARNADTHGFRLYGIDDPQTGIAHVVPPELGLTQPGLLIVGNDSHTSTHGAFGALAFGVGASETRHVLVTQTLAQRRPGNLRVQVEGRLGFGCTAKDLVLAIIERLGAAGGNGSAIEYAGPGITSLGMEGRMTVCNMSIEAGARCGMVAPDEVTLDYLRGRERAPDGDAWERAVEFWMSRRSDPDAAFDREVRLDASAIAPMVTWGTSPEHAVAADQRVPDPADAPSSEKAADWTEALCYMGLEPGQALDSIRVDRVFIGSCTNGRIEDLRAAAEVARRGRAKVPTWVVPGSMSVRRQAEEEGLHRVFEAAGFEWRSPGCSLCTAINGDELAPGERCASTSNRNFRSRQGRDGRTHLVSPAMAAAAAIRGHLTDVRRLDEGHA